LVGRGPLAFDLDVLPRPREEEVGQVEHIPEEPALFLVLPFDPERIKRLGICGVRRSRTAYAAFRRA
jgi:hypothetical protein